ncbi:MAG: hypothetical protein WBP88_10650 [Nitrososphaeraceae archaeon]|jgi:hypothetical protein
MDCNIVLAKYNMVYFSDLNIAELAKLHYPSHVKNGHSLVIRMSEEKTKVPSGL